MYKFSYSDFMRERFACHTQPIHRNILTREDPAFWCVLCDMEKNLFKEAEKKIFKEALKT